MLPAALLILCGCHGASSQSIPLHYLYTVAAARRSWASANKDTLVRYVRALSMAFKYIRAPANRANVVKKIVETHGFAEADVQLTLKLYFEPDRRVLPKAGEISLKGMSQAIAIMGDGGVLKKPLPRADRFVDLQYLGAAGVR